MGSIFAPKPPQIEVKEPEIEEEPAPVDPALEDPDARNRARQRVKEQNARKNRSALRIPLDASGGTGGIQIT